MNIHDVLDYLKAEISKLDSAIAALEGSARRLGRPPKSTSTQPATGKRTMSASARARISAAQKARWAKQKGKPAPKKAAKKAAAPAKSKIMKTKHDTAKNTISNVR
jgi:hypothetical protein